MQKSWLSIHPEVLEAINTNQPVVALESTVITHGLPQPINMDLALHMEAEVRTEGAIPATIAFLRGAVKVGLEKNELEQLALMKDVIKISRRDIGYARAQQYSGGTTVAATMYLAHQAGIRVFATGGIGGVHRGSAADVSADLIELSQTPVAVVCAGAKAILDLPRTLEWLETFGVPVLGWRTTKFPAFFTHTSELKLDLSVEDEIEAAQIYHAHWQSGLSGLLTCVPCPLDVSMAADVVEAALQQAESEAARQGISGKAITPFLLTRLSELTEGETMRANLALLRQNARIAARIASELQRL